MSLRARAWSEPTSVDVEAFAETLEQGTSTPSVQHELVHVGSVSERVAGASRANQARRN